MVAAIKWLNLCLVPYAEAASAAAGKFQQAVAAAAIGRLNESLVRLCSRRCARAPRGTGDAAAKPFFQHLVDPRRRREAVLSKLQSAAAKRVF
jgi:hypothetical protein